MTALPYALTDVDIKQVRESFVQSRFNLFAISTIPKVLCLDRYSSRDNTTKYRLAALDNALLAGQQMRSWAPGVNPPATTTLKEVEVEFEVDIRRTPAINRPFRRGMSFESRFTDLRSNIAPIQLSKAYQAHDADIAALMVNSSLFTQKDFTASTGKGLNSPDDYANQQPVFDIEQHLVLLRPYVNFAGLELRCYMSGKVASTLATHPSYTGAGTGSAVASGIPRADFISRFSALHGCKTFVFDNLANTAALGATPVIGEAFNSTNSAAVLFFGLFDTRNHDLRSQEAEGGADGCIAWGCAGDPTVEVYDNELTHVSQYWGQASYTIYSPRGAAAGVAQDLGFFMRPVTSGANGGIFAS